MASKIRTEIHTAEAGASHNKAKKEIAVQDPPAEQVFAILKKNESKLKKAAQKVGGSK